MLLEMKGFIDINDIPKSGSENRPPKRTDLVIPSNFFPNKY